jgi:hypothetical protein
MQYPVSRSYERMIEKAGLSELAVGLSGLLRRTDGLEQQVAELGSLLAEFSARCARRRHTNIATDSSSQT